MVKFFDASGGKAPPVIQGLLKSTRVAVHWIFDEVERMRALPCAKQPTAPNPQGAPGAGAAITGTRVAPAPHGSGKAPAATGRVWNVIVVPGG